MLNFSIPELHQFLITRLQDRGQTIEAFRAACRRASTALNLPYTVLDGHYTFYTHDIDLQFEAWRAEDGTVYILAVDVGGEDS